MHELTSIIEAYGEAERGGARTVFATVVRTRGSVYRRAGARMLIAIDEHGVCTQTGAISGGCLERDVCERAARVAETGAAVLVTYDTTATEEIVWGLGLGCNGTIEVLLEPLDNEQGKELMRFLAARLEQRTSGATAVVFRADAVAGGAARIGARMMLDAQGDSAGRAICDALERAWKVRKHDPPEPGR